MDIKDIKQLKKELQEIEFLMNKINNSLWMFQLRYKDVLLAARKKVKTKK